MKNLLLTLMAVCLFTFTSIAQDQGEIKVRGGLAIGTKAGVDFDNGDPKMGAGLNLGVEYFVTDQISIAPSYTYFFNSSEGDVSVKPRIFNLDGRYYFGNEINLYALAGIAFQTVTIDFGDESDKGSMTTFNLGAGIEMPIADMLYFNGQIKIMGGDSGDDYETFDGAQLVINAGISYSLDL